MKKITAATLLPTHGGWRKRTVFLIAAAACILAGVIFFSLAPASTPEHYAVAEPATTSVSIQRTLPTEKTAVVSAFGEVHPLWQSTLKARVEGPVVYCSPHLKVGGHVHKGELLVEIEPSHLTMAVAEAKERLATAQLAFDKEQREAREARRNWKRSGFKGEPSSPLVLHGPQLNAARARVEAAKAALIDARTQAGYTEILAPYDGAVMQSHVNPGESLAAGDAVATLFGTEAAEVAVNIDAGQWALLGDPVDSAVALLTDPETTKSRWPARVIRASQHLDGKSRLRTLYLKVDKPFEKTPPLLPGTFVRAEINGRKIRDLLRLPESAVTRDGVVWFVDREDRLRSCLARPVIYGDGVVYINHPFKSLEPLSIAVLPNASFTDGQHVVPHDTASDNALSDEVTSHTDKRS